MHTIFRQHQTGYGIGVIMLDYRPKPSPTKTKRIEFLDQWKMRVGVKWRRIWGLSRFINNEFIKQLKRLSCQTVDFLM